MSSSGSGGIAYVMPSWPAPVGRRCSWAQLKGSSDSRQGRAITRLPAPQLSRTRCARTHGRTHRAPSGSDFAAAGGRSMLVNGPRRRCGRHGEVGADRPAAPASLPSGSFRSCAGPARHAHFGTRPARTARRPTTAPSPWAGGSRRPQTLRVLAQSAEDRSLASTPAIIRSRGHTNPVSVLRTL